MSAIASPTSSSRPLSSSPLPTRPSWWPRVSIILFSVGLFLILLFISFLFLCFFLLPWNDSFNYSVRLNKSSLHRGRVVSASSAGIAAVADVDAANSAANSAATAKLKSSNHDEDLNDENERRAQNENHRLRPLQSQIAVITLLPEVIVKN